MKNSNATINSFLHTRVLTINEKLSVIVLYLLCLIYTEFWVYYLNSQIQEQGVEKGLESFQKSPTFMTSRCFKVLFSAMVAVSFARFISSRWVIRMYRLKQINSNSDTTTIATTDPERTTFVDVYMEFIFDYSNGLFVILAVLNLTLRFMLCEGKIPFMYYMLTPFLALVTPAAKKDRFLNVVVYFFCLLVFVMFLPLGFRQSICYLMRVSQESSGLLSFFLNNVLGTSEAKILDTLTSFRLVNAPQAILGLIELAPLYTFFLWMIYHGFLVKMEAYKNENELAHRQALLEMILSNLPSIVWSVDTNLIVQFCKGKAMHLVGYSGPDMVGREVEEIANDCDDSPTQHMANIHTQRHLLALKGETVTYPMETSRAILQITVSPWKDEKGEILGAVGIANDVTSLVKAENALRTSEEHYRSLVESIQDLIIKIDKNMTILFTNSRTLPFLEKKPKEYTGESVYKLFEVSEHLREVAEKHLRQVFETGSDCKWEWSVPDEGIESLNNTSYFSASVSPIKKDDVVIAATLIVADITEKKRAHESMLLAEKASIASRSKSEFLQVLSHEIRNPLNSILGALQLLSGTPDLSALQTEYIQDVNESAKLLLAIIQDVLDMSKIESGKLTLVNTPVSILDVVETITDMYSTHAFDKNLDLVSFVDPNIPAEVYGDKTRLGQILSNFTTNAIKFTRSGYVYLSAIKDAETKDTVTVTFSCEDSGKGIPETEISKIFKPFSQLSENNQEHKGWGLGLAISDRLVQLMKGTISVHSPPPSKQEGSLFSFTVQFSKHSDIDSSVVSESDKQSVTIADNAHPSKFSTAIALVDSPLVRHVLTQYMSVMKVKNPFVTPSKQYFVDLVEEFVENRDHTQRDDTSTIVMVDSKYYDLIPETLLKQIKEESTNRLKLITLFGPNERTTSILAQSTNPLYVMMRKPIKFARLMSALSERKNSMSSLMWDLSLDQRLQLNSNILQQQSQQSPDEGSNSLEMLVVEDNALNRKIVTRLLEKCGVPLQNIEIAENGAEAVQKVAQRSKPFSTILLDLQMPVMDGKTAAKTIRAMDDVAKSQTPIIALTANAWTNERENCLNIGFNDVVTKPITLDTLICTIKKVLRQT